MPGVLDGIRVIDFGRYLAGPRCIALFANLWAVVRAASPVAHGSVQRVISILCSLPTGRIRRAAFLLPESLLVLFEHPLGPGVIRIMIHAERTARGAQRQVLPIVGATR